MTVSGSGIYSSIGFYFLAGPAFDFLPNHYMSKLNKILIFEFQKYKGSKRLKNASKCLKSRDQYFTRKSQFTAQTHSDLMIAIKWLQNFPNVCKNFQNCPGTCSKSWTLCLWSFFSKKNAQAFSWALTKLTMCGKIICKKSEKRDRLFYQFILYLSSLDQMVHQVSLSMPLMPGFCLILNLQSLNNTTFN